MGLDRLDQYPEPAYRLPNGVQPRSYAYRNKLCAWCMCWYRLGT